MRAAYARRREMVLRIAHSMGSDKGSRHAADGRLLFFPGYAPLKMTSVEICERLLEEAGRGIGWPVQHLASKAEGFVRMTIAASDEEVEEGFKRNRRVGENVK